MTEPVKPPYMPTMDEVHRFMMSNPETSADMLQRIHGENVSVPRARLSSMCVSRVQRGNGDDGYHWETRCSWCNTEGAEETHAGHCPLKQ